MTAEEFLSGFRKTDRLIPVITLVVYFGADEWDGPLSIGEMFSVRNSALQPFIHNYKINLITPKQIEDKEFEKFQSGLGAVLLCAKHSKDRNLNILEQSIYKNLDRKTARLIKELTALDVELDEYDTEGSVDMCEAYENTKRQMIEIGKKRGIEIGKERGIEIGKERGIEIGKERGIENGIKIGKELGIKEMAINLKNMGFSIDLIADVANVSASMIEEWLDATMA